MATQTIEIKVLKVHRIDGENRIKAFVDISINDALLIKSLRMVYLFLCQRSKVRMRNGMSGCVV